MFLEFKTERIFLPRMVKGGKVEKQRHKMD
jgi:hypothetical protein